jgi:putative ABC transport system substrate-binding protein
MLLRQLSGLAVSATGLAVLGGCDWLPATSGRSARAFRVGALFGSSAAAAAPQIEAFRQGLREYGYVEGQNIAIEWRFAEGDNERFPELATQLAQMPVDLLFVPNRVGVAAAKQVTTTIPIVMTDVADVVDTGLVTSLGHPGGNVTGLASPFIEPKRLEILRETLGGAPSRNARVAVVWRPTDSSVVAMRKILVAAEPLNVEVISVQVHVSEDVPGGLDTVSRAGADALFAFLDPLILIHLQTIVDFAAQHRLPATYSDRRFVDAGGLMSYGANRPEMYRRTASYIDRILKGARVSELPVELTSVFEFVVNLTAAEALGITIPPGVAAQVTEWVH